MLPVRQVPAVLNRDPFHRKSFIRQLGERILRPVQRRRAFGNVNLAEAETSEFTVRPVKSDAEIARLRQLVGPAHENLFTSTDGGIFIAEDSSGRARGAAAIILDGPAGLPLEASFGIPERDRRMGEACCLLLDQAPAASSQLGLGLLRAVYRRAFGVLNLDALIMAVPPEHCAFYETVFGFTVLGDGSCREYLNRPSVGVELDLTRSADALAERYAGSPPNRNLYRYLHADMEGPNWTGPGVNHLEPAEGWSLG